MLPHFFFYNHEVMMRILGFILLLSSLAHGVDESQLLEVLTIKQRYAELVKSGAELNLNTLRELRGKVRKHIDTLGVSNSIDVVASAALVVCKYDWYFDCLDGWRLGSRLRQLKALESGNPLAEEALVALNSLKWYVENPVELFTKQIADLESRGAPFKPLNHEPLYTVELGNDPIRALELLLERVKSNKESDARAFSGRPKISEDYKNWKKFDAGYDEKIIYYEKYLKYLRNKPGFDAAIVEYRKYIPASDPRKVAP
jgi:hypothetical protein